MAALRDDAHQAKGLDSALKTLAHEPFGSILLSIVALELIVYGVFSLVEACYRRVGGGLGKREPMAAIPYGNPTKGWLRRIKNFSNCQAFQFLPLYQHVQQAYVEGYCR